MSLDANENSLQIYCAVGVQMYFFFGGGGANHSVVFVCAEIITFGNEMRRFFYDISLFNTERIPLWLPMI